MSPVTLPPRERPPARPILATEDDLHGETVQVLTQTRQWSLGVLLGEQDIAGAKQYRVHVLGTPDQVVVDEGKILFLPDQPALAPEMHTVARYRLGLLREPSTPYTEPVRCITPDIAARFLHHLLETYDREVVGALLLSTGHHVIGHTIAYIGTLNGSLPTRPPRTDPPPPPRTPPAPPGGLAEPRGLLVPALLANAASIAIFHNHPSGDPTPSPDDIRLTERMIEAGKIVGIKVVDHIILGERPAFTSLSQMRGGLFT